ncbi:RagB/SusD family nutrient uptake outer membrane protein [Algoriphagus yeomjeoni]|nr:RagB/SusD family nutrient uptake outer membrane protein [Algoriphagus yeomjeoni]
MKLSKFIYFIIFLSISGCEGFLDTKPEKSLIIPKTLDDFQAILDAEPRLMNSITKMGFLASDEIVMADPLVSLLTLDERAAYLWEGDFYTPDAAGVDWSVGYQRVFYANVVIEGIRDYKPTSPFEIQRASELDAAARFHRAFGHFMIAAQFMGPYDPGNPTAPGIPIRNSADLNAPSPRVTMKEALDFIREDLEFASGVLPDFPEIPTRASAWATEAMLSRVSLYMQDYEKAYLHSGNALEIKNELLDYNTLDSGLRFVFPRFNVEVIHHAHMITGRFYNSPQTYVNPELINLYDSLDLRLLRLMAPSPLEGLYNLQGRYSGESFLFGGLATDEVVLDHAEAAARLGYEEEALQDLNYLLKNRYLQGAFIQLDDLSGDSLIWRIAEERRKELLYRGVRWLDMKRYFQDPAMAKINVRTYQNREYRLEPNSSKYTFPIPPREVRLNDQL